MKRFLHYDGESSKLKTRNTYKPSNLLSFLRKKPRRLGRGWIARTAYPCLVLILVRRLLLLDALPNYFN